MFLNINITNCHHHCESKKNRTHSLHFPPPTFPHTHIYPSSIHSFMIVTCLLQSQPFFLFAPCWRWFYLLSICIVCVCIIFLIQEEKKIPILFVKEKKNYSRFPHLIIIILKKINKITMFVISNY